MSCSYLQYFVVFCGTYMWLSIIFFSNVERRVSGEAHFSTNHFSGEGKHVYFGVPTKLTSERKYHLIFRDKTYHGTDQQPVKGLTITSRYFGCDKTYHLIKRKGFPVTDWGYGDDNGPHTWPVIYPGCAGRRQSPIALSEPLATPSLTPSIGFRNYEVMPGNITITNSGTTVVLRGNYTLSDCRTTPQIKLGTETYMFESLHFHWGASDNFGSEHTVSDERFPLEMNVVHMRYRERQLKRSHNEHKRVKRTGQQSTSTVILVIFFEFTDEYRENTGIHKLVNQFRRIRKPHTTACLGDIPLTMLVPQFSKNYFVYTGSQTTPPCTECVTYVVSTESAGITREQVAEFRKLKDPDGNPLVNNFRPIQPNNGRLVRFIM